MGSVGSRTGGKRRPRVVGRPVRGRGLGRRTRTPTDPSPVDVGVDPRDEGVGEYGRLWKWDREPKPVQVGRLPSPRGGPGTGREGPTVHLIPGPPSDLPRAGLSAVEEDARETGHVDTFPGRQCTTLFVLPRRPRDFRVQCGFGLVGRSFYRPSFNLRKTQLDIGVVVVVFLYNCRGHGGLLCLSNVSISLILLQLSDPKVGSTDMFPLYTCARVCLPLWCACRTSLQFRTTVSWSSTPVPDLVWEGVSGVLLGWDGCGTGLEVGSLGSLLLTDGNFDGRSRETIVSGSFECLPFTLGRGTPSRDRGFPGTEAPLERGVSLVWTSSSLTR